MLLSLHIENVAIIDVSDIEFSCGFNVLTGETGAGKSIIIDSINLLLGTKGSHELISSGKDYAFVSAVFCAFNKAQTSFLAENDVFTDEDGDLIISRRITRDGRNLSKINGKAVTVSTLKEISQVIMSIHGQRDGSKILNPDTHIDYLDDYCNFGSELEDYKQKYSQIKTIRKKLQTLNDIKEKRDSIEESLKFKIAELEKAELKAGEYEKLKQLRVTAGNSAAIGQALSACDSIISGEDTGMLDCVATAINMLTPLNGIPVGVENIINTLTQVKTELEDISENVGRLLSQHEESDYSPDYIEERLYAIEKILTKYSTEQNAIAMLSDYSSQLSQLDDNENELETATEEYKSCLTELEKAAEKLSAVRANAASALHKLISEQLSELDMPKTDFEVRITRNITPRGGNKYTQTGYDCVEFMISPNTGQEPKPISKIASGGELSRIMLCLKTILNGGNDECSSIVYDEIDNGVSGATAQKIGYKLKKISKNRQVFCVTHLAQIAALADYNYKVEKNLKNGRTVSEIRLLDSEERRAEVARIMGGVDISEQLLRSADELIKNSEKC